MSAPVIATRRIPSGVPGFDEALQGGLPRDALLLIEGPPGSGKTTFGLQFLLQGVRDGETCLLATNAETVEQLKWIAASHAWNLDGVHITEFTEPAGTDDEKGADYTLFPEAEVSWERRSSNCSRRSRGCGLRFSYSIPFRSFECWHQRPPSTAASSGAFAISCSRTPARLLCWMRHRGRTRRTYGAGHLPTASSSSSS